MKSKYVTLTCIVSSVGIDFYDVLCNHVFRTKNKLLLQTMPDQYILYVKKFNAFFRFLNEIDVDVALTSTALSERIFCNWYLRRYSSPPQPGVHLHL